MRSPSALQVMEGTPLALWLKQVVFMTFLLATPVSSAFWLCHVAKYSA